MKAWFRDCLKGQTNPIVDLVPRHTSLDFHNHKMLIITALISKETLCILNSKTLTIVISIYCGIKKKIIACPIISHAEGSGCPCVIIKGILVQSDMTNYSFGKQCPSPCPEGGDHAPHPLYSGFSYHLKSVQHHRLELVSYSHNFIMPEGLQDKASHLYTQL